MFDSPNTNPRPSGEEISPTPEERLYFLDNLRTFAVFLVVLYHCGITYESSGVGATFWIVDDPATNHISGLVNLVLDIFVMPLFFFVSGYFTPPALDKRSRIAFIRTKARRLLLPWLVAMVSLIPIYKLIFLGSRGLPQEHWTTYFHFSNGIFSQSWLWFLPVLFLFHLLYLGLGLLGLRGSVSIHTAVPIALVVGFAISLSMDRLGLRGWTKTPLVDFQNERLPIYFLAFLVGALCFRRRVFAPEPQKSTLYAVVTWTAWIPITSYLVFLLFPWLNPGKTLISATGDTVMRWLSFHGSLFCLLFGTITAFRLFQNKTGPLRARLARLSYGTYLVHVVVLGTLAFGLLPLAAPSWLKYLLLTGSTYLLSSAIAWILPIR